MSKTLFNNKGFYGDPRVWGPHAWDFMLSVAMTYPDDPDQQIANNYKNFYYSLADVLPCVVCREHYKQNIRDLPIDDYLGNSKLLSKWVVKIHNIVNRITKKRIVGYEEALKLFVKNNKNRIENNSNSKGNYWIIGGGTIIALLVIAYFYQNHQNHYSS